MRFIELAIFFAIFLAIGFAAISFLNNFGVEESMPAEITGAWTSAQEQINSAQASFSENAQKIQQGGLSAIAGIFGLAFSGIFYIVVVVGSVLLSIPQTIYGGIIYAAGVIGIPSSVVNIIIGLIGVMAALAIISFVAGREL